ncbi:MAG: arginine--tRNA ligase [Candidatus Kapaibacterium sp.]
MEKYLEKVFLDGLGALGVGAESLPASAAIKFEIPQNTTHGDLSTNIALLLSKPLKRAPRDLALELITKLKFDESKIRSVEVAGPGFINIAFSNSHVTDGLKEIIEKKATYGRTYEHKGETVNVEWVSANPTGLLHAGHGRGICLGAVITSLLDWTGYNVVKEYYFNNAGNQMRNLAKSIQVRYLQELGENIELDDDGYKGQEIKDIAVALKAEFGDSKREADQKFFQDYGEQSNFLNIKKTLAKLGIAHDIFFNENSLYDSGAVKSTIAEFRDKGLAYDKDGAVWLKLSEMGQQEDRVIVKSTGEPTYRLPDICYHRDKLSRGYDLVVDIFGADHIATVPDVLAAVRSLGFDTSKVKVVIHQMVSFISGGELIKFSKRSGGNYLLDELLEDVGADACKFFFNMRAVGSHLEFDVELAKDQSDKNPVYYVQYAHARIASILRFAAQQELVISEDQIPELSVLEHVEEIALIKTLMRFPDVVRLSAQSFAPHHVCEYLREVAAQFHKFYHECRIVGTPEPLQSARLALAQATKRVLANGCQILGISAPESM